MRRAKRSNACHRAENLHYIHSANEPLLINGVGTYALEIIETLQQRGEQARRHLCADWFGQRPLRRDYGVSRAVARDENLWRTG
jgi:hypothetical protein